MKKVEICLILILVTATVGLSNFASNAYAKPSYASSTGNDCSYCHDHGDGLNKNGLAYKAAGKPRIDGWKNQSAQVQEPPQEKPSKIIIFKIGDSYMTVNGTKKEIDPGIGTKPLILNGRTLLPIRSVIENLGGTVTWDGSSKQVTINFNSKTIILTVSSDRAYVSDQGTSKYIDLDVPVQIIKGRTMIPIRFVIENLGLSLKWENVGQTITINY